MTTINCTANGVAHDELQYSDGTKLSRPAAQYAGRGAVLGSVLKRGSVLAECAAFLKRPFLRIAPSAHLCGHGGAVRARGRHRLSH